MKKAGKKYKTFTFFIVIASKTYLLRRKSYHSQYRCNINVTSSCVSPTPKTPYRILMAVADVTTTHPGVAAVAGRRVGSGPSFFGSAAFLG